MSYSMLREEDIGSLYQIITKLPFLYNHYKEGEMVVTDEYMIDDEAEEETNGDIIKRESIPTEYFVLDGMDKFVFLGEGDEEGKKVYRFLAGQKFFSILKSSIDQSIGFVRNTNRLLFPIEYLTRAYYEENRTEQDEEMDEDDEEYEDDEEESDEEYEEEDDDDDSVGDGDEEDQPEETLLEFDPEFTSIKIAEQTYERAFVYPVKYQSREEL